MKAFIVFVLLFGVVAYVLFLHKGVSDKPAYVSSDNCKNCHETFYESWKNNTLHPRMFRPVKTPDDILGDFESKDPALTFKKEDVQFVLGNKWEQVYVKMIDG